MGHELCRPGWFIHTLNMRRENVCPHTAVTGSTNSFPLLGHVSASNSSALETASGTDVASGVRSDASTRSTPDADCVAERRVRRICD